MGGLKKQTPPAMVMTGVEVYHMDTRELIFYSQANFTPVWGFRPNILAAFATRRLGKCPALWSLGHVTCRGLSKGGRDTPFCNNNNIIPLKSI